VNKDVEKREPLDTADENVKWVVMENYMKFPEKIKK
jgi:hypothetical protein